MNIIQIHNPVINQQYNLFSEIIKLNSGNHSNFYSKQNSSLNPNNNYIPDINSVCLGMKTQ